MKSRRNRKLNQRTRKYKGGGVFSKPIGTPKNVNLSKYLKTQNFNVTQLPAKSQMNYYTTKRKIKQRENDLARLTASGVSSGQAIGAGAGSAENYEKLQNELTSLREKMKQYEPEKTVRGSFRLKRYNAVNFGKIDNMPVEFVTLKLRETDYNNMMGLNNFILSKIFLLRREAFPEDYGKGADYLNEKMLQIWPHYYKMVNGKKISTTDPIANSFQLVYEAPYHCKPIPGTDSAVNYTYSLIYYTKKELDRIKDLAEFGIQRTPEPTLVSSCFVNHCILESGTTVAELMGVATAANYKKQGFAKKMITQVLNILATTSYGSVEFTVTNGEVETSNRGLIDYVWLYYDKTKPELADFYKQFGFKELTKSENDPELKELYIGNEHFLKPIQETKKAKWMEEMREEKRKYSGEPLEFVDENNYMDWKEKKIEYLYRNYGTLTSGDGSPVPDFFTGKTINDFRDKKRERLHEKKFRKLYDEAQEKDKEGIREMWKHEAEEYKEEIRKKYANAIFEVWISKKVYKPIIIDDVIKESLKDVTEEEEKEALEFERENVQMVLSMADWVYQMNKQNKK